MSTEEATSFTDFEFESNRLGDLASQQAWKLDGSLHVQFYKHAELNTFRSQEEGRKIYDEFVYVRILSPANRLNVIERRATDEDKQRFARHYAAFLAKAEQLQSGTPLAELPTITAGQVLELRHLKVDTVEQLALLPDQTAQLLGTGGLELKLRAIRFLDERKNSGALAEQVRQQAAEIAELRALVAKTQAPAAGASDIKVSGTVAK